MQEFLQFLAQLRHGEALDEYAAALLDTTAAVVATGKSGSITLTIKLTPQGPGGPVIIDDRIQSRLPQPDLGRTFMFVDGEGHFTRRDPRQPDLPLRPAAVHDTPHDPETGEVLEDAVAEAGAC